MPLYIDKAAWPLVRVEMYDLTDDENAEYLRNVEAWLRGPERFAILIDTDRAQGRNGGPVTRKAQAEFMKKHAAAMQERVAALALVIAHPLVRSIVTSILWMQPVPAPFAIFKDRASAERWARRRLAGLD